MEPLPLLNISECVNVLDGFSQTFCSHRLGFDRLVRSGVHTEGELDRLERYVESLADALEASPPTSLAALVATLHDVRKRRHATSDAPDATAIVDVFVTSWFESNRNADRFGAKEYALGLEYASEMLAEHFGQHNQHDAHTTVLHVAERASQHAIDGFDANMSLARLVVSTADAWLDCLEGADQRGIDVAWDGSFTGGVASDFSGGVDIYAAILAVVLDVFVSVVHHDELEVVDYDTEYNDSSVTNSANIRRSITYSTLSRYTFAATVTCDSDAAERIESLMHSLSSHVEVTSVDAQGVVPKPHSSESQAVEYHVVFETNDLAPCLESLLGIAVPRNIRINDRRFPDDV